MLDNEIDYDHEQKVMEFDFPLPINRASINLDKRHSTVAKNLSIDEDDELYFLFTTVASLCDPFTQPEEEKTLLSLDCVSDLLIALSYTKYSKDLQGEDIEIESIKLELSLEFFKVLRKIHTFLCADNELTLRYVNNDEEHFLKNLHLWNPKQLRDDRFLKLMYSMACVLIMGIYKLFKPRTGEYNLVLNPYLHYFLKLWKCHTNIILLGLEIDRRIEFDNHEKDLQNQTPDMIKDTLKGSSSIRYVLAWILNQNPSLFYDEEGNVLAQVDDFDIKKESLLNFAQPLVRKKINGGSLLIDMRFVIIALLILNSGISFAVGQYDQTDQPSSNEDEATRRLNQSKPITEIGDILIDLEYDDRFEEDIRYIFEYEYDESEGEDAWLDVSGEDETKVEKPETFDDKKVSNAIRNDEATAIEFDEYGRDWRDRPRGQNQEYQDWFLKKLLAFTSLENRSDSEDFFATVVEIYDTLEFLNTNSIEGNTEAEERAGQVLINSVAMGIKQEGDETVDDPTMSDFIYQYWFSLAREEDIQATQENNKLIVPIFNITKFELLLHNNSKLARCLMDEMLMSKGYRRVLIWFLTHNVNLSALLIDYVFELLAGLRGNPERQAPYKFTRMGDKLELSEVEQLMLLHEFLTNSSVYLSATSGIEIEDGYKVVLAESIAKKYMTLLCLMINQLINIGIINLEREKTGDDDIHDYKNELQVLLINWVGKVPEARQLFFKVKNTNYETEKKEVAEPQGELDTDQLQQLINEYGPLSTVEISDDLQSNQDHMSVMSKYAKRLETYLKTVLAHQIGAEIIQTTEAQSTNAMHDFRFFLNNFNTLSKIEYVAESLFDNFEAIVSTGQEKDKQKEEETVEAEFNSEFLNGEGEFDPKSEKKKSKNKKKKKKSKKK